MTQEALAEKASITTRALSQIETGNANPTWATVRDLAAALGVTMAELARLAERHEG
jgi:transcriptional regulator with XRE-family HTH domain